MDQNSLGDGDFIIDIQISRSIKEQVGIPAPSIEIPGGLVTVDCETILNITSNVTNCREGTPDNLNVSIKKEEGVKADDIVGSRTRNERRKSSGKPPKPPRPAKGYSLDAADQKLIKEIAELAMLKRARVERMKALEKMKAAKASSVPNSRGSFFAMFFSVFFFLLIVYHGMYCSSSSTSHFHGSPEAAGSVENLIMAQHQKGFSSSEIYRTTSESPKLVEQISGLDPVDKLTKASG